MAVNVDGTMRPEIRRAAQSTPPRFIHLSSLAAREPHLSPYAASKAAGEAVVRGCRRSVAMSVIVLRPPAVYGPGDPETLRIFRMAARGVLPMPSAPGVRLSLAHVDDAAAAVIAALWPWASCPAHPLNSTTGHAERTYAGLGSPPRLARP